MEIDHLDLNTNVLLTSIKTDCIEILKTNLIGVYLHGSIVMGCYNHLKSDLDFIIVTKQSASFIQKNKLMDKVINSWLKLAPSKGLEFHLMTIDQIKDSHYPMGFDFHFSRMYLNHYLENPLQYIREMHGTDPDLAAHITIINHYGYTLYGLPSQNIFNKVPPKEYWNSIITDLRGSIDCKDEDLAYYVLNSCRVFAFKEAGLVLSKKDGGEWGVKNLPDQYIPIIEAALEEYEAIAPLDLKNYHSRQNTIEFLTYVTNEINKEDVVG